jgi:hypothetical protein
MNNGTQVCISLAIAISLPLAMGQRRDKDFPLRGVAEREIRQSDLPAFLEATRTNDPYLATAILQTGKTNDWFWVPYLKPLLKKKHRPGMDNDDAGSAQMALAKLGEKQQLQEIACEANFGSPSIQYNIVTHKLKYVQGWFSIEILAGWLDENHKFQALFVDRPSDMLFTRPQDVALKVLPEIVPNPPPFSSEPHVVDWMSQNDDEKLVSVHKAWREWIHKNEESLRKLTPLGDGLDLSRSTCKRVLAHDRHFDRSNLQ